MGVLEGENPSLGMLVLSKKFNLWHNREFVSDGDVDSRETHKRMSRPKCESVKFVSGRIGRRPCEKSGSLIS